MARIYSSRIMLDPSVLQNMNNVIQQRYANEAARRQAVLSPMRDLLKSTGNTLDEYIAERQRAKEVANWSDDDPIAKAAKEEYIRTGSSNPMMSYKMQKLAAEAKQRADEKADAEKKYQKELHDAVTLREDRNKYSQLQANMFKAMDEGNMADAQTYKNQMEGLENHYKQYYPDYNNPFGDTAQSMWDARSEQKRLADEKLAQEQEEKKIAEKQEAYENALDVTQSKEITDKSFEMRNFIMDNFMPVGSIKDKNEQIYLANLVRNTKMTDEDKKYLLDKIYGETKQEQISKAQNSAAASKAGEATGTAIDEAKNKDAAKSYDGKTLIGPDWKNIPDSQKKYLKRDGNGKVTYIGG